MENQTGSYSVEIQTGNYCMEIQTGKCVGTTVWKFKQGNVGKYGVKM
jgi:hypothetical protein